MEIKIVRSKNRTKTISAAPSMGYLSCKRRPE